MIQTLFGSLQEESEPKKKGLFDRMKQARRESRWTGPGGYATCLLRGVWFVGRARPRHPVR